MPTTKPRLLYIYKYLIEHTDVEHPVTGAEKLKSHVYAQGRVKSDNENGCS